MPLRRIRLCHIRFKINEISGFVIFFKTVSQQPEILLYVIGCIVRSKIYTVCLDNLYFSVNLAVK